MFALFLLALGYTLTLGNDIVSDSDTTVQLEQGKLFGKTSIDRFGGEFHSFLAIPYAKPPIGKLRFKDPVEPEPWEGTLNAVTDVPKCIQLYLNKSFGQEDCLYLNVHTPNLPSPGNGLKPVMVFIHGGAFIEGSSTIDYFGAEFLMPNVVLVTINYRLGLFGFISSEDGTIPGNFGLKDQTMALRWVQKNIEKFGGDKAKVTIFGESAGGASVHLQMLSPKTKGLFHRVIAMSGTARNEWTKGIKGTFEIKAEMLGVERKDTLEMLEIMQGFTAEEIINVQTKDGLIIPIHEAFECSPVVDGEFLPASSKEIIASNNYNKVPLMIGFTSVDGLVVDIIKRIYTDKPYIVSNYWKIVPNDLKVNGGNLKEFTKLIDDFYYDGEKPNKANVGKFVDLATDLWFINGIKKSVEEHYKNDDLVYVYRFSGDTALNYFKRQLPETANVSGACHIDDLGYLFKTIKTPEILPGSDEDKAIGNIVGLFTSFAETGKPSFGQVNWIPATNLSFNTLDIGVDLTSEVNVEKKRMDFWDNVYSTFGRR